MAAYVPKTEQFSHQKRVLEETWDRPGYALWWEQGTGKSKGLIDNGGLLYAEKAIEGMFVLAPNGLHRNFVTKEIPKHLPDEMREEGVQLFYRTDKSETKWHQEECRAFLEHKGGMKVLSMSYDGFMTEAGRRLAAAYLTSHRCLYGTDESGRFKEPKADRTKRVLKSSPFAPFKRIMTGTPIANAPWDAWSQIKFCDDAFWRAYGLDSPEAMKAQFGVWEKGARRVNIAQAKWPSGKLKVFRYPPDFPDSMKSEYMIKDGVALLRFPKQVMDDDGRRQFKNLDRLREILAPIRSRILKSEVFDLPPKVYTPLEFDLSPKQRKAYDSLSKLGFAIAESGESCSANLALTVMLRLQQIACGYLVADFEPGQEDPVVIPIDPNPRLELLSEVVQDLNHQAIIWARFTPDVDAIMERLAKMGLTAVRYDGRVDDDQRAMNEDAFHAGAAQFFVAKASTGGEGLTLNEAKTHIYYSNTFKLIERLQSEDRSHRWGQDSRVNYIDLIARDTIDEAIIFALQNKLDIAGAVTGDGLKDWIRPRDRLL